MKKKKTIRKKPRRAPRKRPAPVFWTTASGATILPANMGRDHLRNTVAMLHRRHAHDLSLLRLLEPCAQTADLTKAIIELVAKFEAAPSLHPAYPALAREFHQRECTPELDEELCD